MIEKKNANSWQQMSDKYRFYLQENLLIVAAAVSLLVIAGGGWYGYRYHAGKKEEAAVTILADCLAQYDQASQGKTQWADVEQMCHAGYQKFSATKTANYILAVEVDALLAQDKQELALEKLTLLTSSLGNSPLYPLYALKRSLLILDMPDAALHEKALQEIEQLANDSKNIYADAAQYHLGAYYRLHNNNEKAIETWKALIAINDSVTDVEARSPWATLAQQKINGLS